MLPVSLDPESPLVSAVVGGGAVVTVLEGDAVVEVVEVVVGFGSVVLDPTLPDPVTPSVSSALTAGPHAAVVKIAPVVAANTHPPKRRCRDTRARYQESGGFAGRTRRIAGGGMVCTQLASAV